MKILLIEDERSLLESMKKYLDGVMIVAVAVIFGCNNKTSKESTELDSTSEEQHRVVTENDSLPAPYATKSVRNQSKVIGWAAGKMPTAPAGFTVSKFADSLTGPRWIYVVPNGDILVAQADREGKKRE